MPLRKILIMLLGLGGESESMKMKTGKLFYNISERTVQVESYDLSKDYYEFIKEAQGKNCRQVIITSDIMIQLSEFLLTEGNSTITSISFFVEDADLQDEIDQIVSCLSNNPAYWGVLKTRLDFLRKFDSIDIKEICFRGKGNLSYLASILVNGVFSVSESAYCILSTKLAKFVEGCLQ